jgi:hypothetical protein
VLPINHPTPKKWCCVLMCNATTPPLARRSDQEQRTCTMNRIIGFFASKCTGFPPSSTPPCGGTLTTAVAAAVAALDDMVEGSRSRANQWGKPLRVVSGTIPQGLQKSNKETTNKSPTRLGSYRTWSQRRLLSQISKSKGFRISRRQPIESGPRRCAIGFMQGARELGEASGARVRCGHASPM